MDLGEIGRGYRVDPFGSGQGPMVVSYKYGDEHVGSGTMELVSCYIRVSGCYRVSFIVDILSNVCLEVSCSCVSLCVCVCVCVYARARVRACVCTCLDAYVTFGIMPLENVLHACF
jgi:hypothetical protein